VSTIESGADGSRPAHEGDRSPVESTRDNLHVLTMNEALGTKSAIVRQFRQIVVWLAQVMPISAGAPVQCHWEALESMDCASGELERRHPVTGI
jgi:hypothetical protein